jgi:hypothetical protein
MITEDYVSFEVAKLLKEKGFDEKVISFYPPGDIQRPTLQMAMKWLREVHKIYITTHIKTLTCPKSKVDGFLSNIWYIPKTNGGLMCCEYAYPPMKVNGGEYWSTYEQAAESAIKYSLEYLIQKIYDK